MKKAFLLLVLGAFCFAACTPETNPAKDTELTGTTVDVSGLGVKADKLFVLNEGGLGANNATLDFLRFSDGLYVTGSFKKMNPEVGAGLGDVGNDIAVNGDEVWMVINNSGIVEVVSAKNETEIVAVSVPTPRNIAFDGKYAYVTSWAGAYATYTYDSGTGYSTITASANPKGQVYRINLKTKKIEGTVEVGYQPEGIAVYKGKIYVANSGGISSQLAPNYAYDNTVSIIDAKTFQVEKTVEVQVNLKSVFSDGKGMIYVTTLGNYYDVHSGLYMIDVTKPDTPVKVADYVSVAAVSGDTVYCIGAENEFDWSAAKTWTAWSCKKGEKTSMTLSVNATSLYSLFAVDGDTFFVGDAGDYFNPGTVTCYDKGQKLWTVNAGVSPGHFAIW